MDTSSNYENVLKDQPNIDRSISANLLLPFYSAFSRMCCCMCL